MAAARKRKPTRSAKTSERTVSGGKSAPDSRGCPSDAPVPAKPPGVGSVAGGEPLVRWEGEGGLTPGDDAARAAKGSTEPQPPASPRPKRPPAR